ncbi:YxeA family protein [Enterococcus villorum]|uniref:Amino acid ABC transporter ATP-binding protein n=2 Tax=Enterococcus villorum TaxID=112904 RepID=A0A511J5A4_9ENTE|nr:YxeA family protein [Enterococcus villorum]EOH89678.1 hypothetical protein UAO_01364 [Enterococcus villorum ATCC 700913]EOW78349.1 hypothetical protein I591_01205 [Enterococcus villorum ATCC 700913]GEL92869.1 hypothetical protein EVI01_22060 [Enterococcus villorum]
MKKLISLLVILAVFIGGSFVAYHYFYGGTAYYTKITTLGTRENEKDDESHDTTHYIYNQTAYNKDGESKQVVLSEFREKPLKLNAYLKLKVNPRKGVISWEEVSHDEVPKKAIEKIE